MDIKKLIFTNLIYYQLTLSSKISVMLKKKTPVETEKRKKVSLPAVLFNRNSLKSIENSSMMSNTSSIAGEPTCENHPHKKGKYSVLNEQKQEEQSYYCEKCAILLASKGFQVTKLSIQESKITEQKKINPRDQQLMNFIKDVEKQVNILNQNKKQTNQQLNQLEDICQNKIQKISLFFQEMFKMMELFKNKQIYQNNQRKAKTKEQLANYVSYLTEKIELLGAMKSDIASSKDSIISQTREDDYQLVMAHYKKNLSEAKIEPIIPLLVCQNLPPLQALQCMFAELFNGESSGVCFSFDSYSKGQPQ